MSNYKLKWQPEVASTDLLVCIGLIALELMEVESLNKSGGNVTSTFPGDEEYKRRLKRLAVDMAIACKAH